MLGFGFCLTLAAPLLQERDRVVRAEEVPPDAIVVLLAGAADATARMDAMRALCNEDRPSRRVLVGDDDELEDETGRAWGPHLVDELTRRFGGCFTPELVPGRVRTTREELHALDTFLATDERSQGKTLVFVTSPYHRARVAYGAAEERNVHAHDRRFLAMPPHARDRAPHVVGAELLRLARDAMGLSDVLGRRTLDRLRASSPWPRPEGQR